MYVIRSQANKSESSPTYSQFDTVLTTGIFGAKGEEFLSLQQIPGGPARKLSYIYDGVAEWHEC